MEPNQPLSDAESAALAALKGKTDTKKITLAFARDAQAFLDNYRRSKQYLADQLGVNRPDLSLILGLLTLDEQAQSTLEGKVLSIWAVRNLLEKRPPQSSTGPSTPSTDVSTEHSTVSTPPSTASTDPEKNENKASTPLHNGDRPENHGIDAPKNPFKHAKRSEGGGDSGDKTVGELIVSVLIGLSFVPLYFFCWMVHQRAFDDLCELEDRTYRRILKSGAWNMIRWVLVVLLLLFIWLALPRIGHPGTRGHPHDSNLPAATGQATRSRTRSELVVGTGSSFENRRVPAPARIPEQSQFT